MDYVITRIEKKITLLKSLNQQREICLFYQVRLEYILVFILSYLWNKNFDSLEVDDKEYIISKVFRPTIGDIFSICRKLDVKKEIFKVNKIYRSLEKYTHVRNSFLGHGYTFADGVEDLSDKLSELYEEIISSNTKKLTVLTKKNDLVLVTAINKDTASGVRFLCEESSFSPWVCSRKVFDFKLDNIYGSFDPYNYFRLSPFIDISFDEEIFLYCSVQERLLGQLKYNQLFKTKQIYKEWEEFCDLKIDIDEFREKSSNGTILNTFVNNYKKYIPLKIKEKVSRFLLEDKASVSATVWGHGGVGKTATIQSVCEDLANVDKYRNKIFDYIIFLTAKDRKFNFETGEVEDILSDERVESLESIVQKINKILFDEPTNSVEDILNYQGKLLLVIDDFETFSSEEKTRITEFIRKLNINNHKVVITTRADLRIGEQITTNELSEEETLNFLLELIPIEFPQKIIVSDVEKTLRHNDRYKTVFEITGGRPLFIFQFAHLYAANQNFPDKILQYDIKAYGSATKFLFERVYEYLSPDAKKLFVIIGKLVQSDDLSHLIGKAKFVLSMEHDEDRFNSAVEELIKLKIIEVREGDVFHIYSKEIWQIMINYYQQFDEPVRENWGIRLERVGYDKNSVEQSLLQRADVSRVSGSESEVINAYNQLLNRVSCPQNIKLLALLNLGAYLFNDRGKIEEAIKLFEDKAPVFAKSGNFIKMYATYLWTTKEYRRRAIKILIEYFVDKESFFQENIDLELYGLWITYHSSLIIAEIDELASEKEYRSIIKSVYNEQLKEKERILLEIYKKGRILFDHIKRLEIDDGKISTTARMSSINGLLYLTEVCIRLKEFDAAENICLYAFEKFPENAMEQFYSKFKKLYVSQNKFSHSAYNIYKEFLKAKNKNIINFEQVKIPKIGQVRVIKLPNSAKPKN